MRVSVAASKQSITIGTQPSELPPILDIHLEGHRVWSAHVRRGLLTRNTVLRWPDALRKYLKGRAELAVVDPATGETLATRKVRFPGEGRVDVTDARGRWLSMNKWDRLGPTLDGDTGVQDRLIASTEELVSAMQEWGYPVYMVGGTLLGAIRNGQMMAHDDDVDLAWLCDAETIADVSLEGLELERRLKSRGWAVVRHSMAHVQVTFFNEAGETDHYIDIFTGFYESGLYNQPFALRGELARDSLVPTGTMKLNGVDLPAPARPEGWLEYSYGPDWRTPDPSFKFITPKSTIRLFETKFGVYNRQRVWWEKHYEQFAERLPSERGIQDARDFLQRIPDGAPVIDLGCGDGRLTEVIAAGGHQVDARDYSYEGLRLARQTSPSNVDYQYLNFNDRRAVLLDAMQRSSRGEQPYIFGGEFLHCVPTNGHESLMWWLRGVLTPETFAYFTVFTDRHPNRRDHNPTTWRLPMRELSRLARSAGLSVKVLAYRTVHDNGIDRTQRTVQIWR